MEEEVDEDASTEVVTLAEWMYESTMFNIINKLHFFKHYVEKKVFNTWRLNVRYRLFCKTRNNLVHHCFIAKPTFANNLLEINKVMFDL